MIYVKIYFLISVIVTCFVIGLRLFFVDIDLSILRWILGCFLIGVPLTVVFRIMYGDKIDEYTKDNN